jgi:arylsulfatase A-like enzyme
LLHPGESAAVAAGLRGNAFDYSRNPIQRSVRHTYDPWKYKRSVALLQEFDRSLEGLFSELEKIGEDNYLVCVTADHGHSYFGTDPYILSEQMLHVPFFLRGAGVPIKTSDALMEANVDLLPTLAGAAGIDLDGPYSGKNVLGEGFHREDVLAESIYGAEYKALLRSERWIYRVGAALSEAKGQCPSWASEELYTAADYPEAHRNRAHEMNEMCDKFASILKARTQLR